MSDKVLRFVKDQRGGENCLRSPVQLLWGYSSQLTPIMVPIMVS